MQPTLKILFVAAEAEPFIKIGGLGDVAGSLPKALFETPQADPPASGGYDGKVDIRVVIPYHKKNCCDACVLESLGMLSIPHPGDPIQAEVFLCQCFGFPVYLVASPLITADDAVYHNNAGLDGKKYAFFSLAALELTRSLNWYPDILHANDWHTALAVYVLRRNPQAYPELAKTKTVLTVHNLPYLGVGAGGAFCEFGIQPPEDSALPAWAKAMPLPLGLFAADAIVFPSPTYSKEVLTPEFGSGLEAFLKTRQDAISGILNGIDERHWNPAAGQAIRRPFDSHNLELRAENKAALLEEFALDPNPDIPLLTMITRMDPQKGVDLVPEAFYQFESNAWQAIILGLGQPEIEAQLRRLQERIPERVQILFRYDAALSQRLYAGADILLMPSRYEPCGLNQMIAMRYGCVPLARAVGGLADTIVDFDSSGNSTGFLFADATSTALAATLQRAFRIFEDKAAWRALQKRGMQQDFSWDRSARKYLNLYQRLMG